MARRSDRHRRGVIARWIILRTRGGQTLPLMRSLRSAGFGVWTPARTIRRVLRAKTLSGTRTIESDVPILPTFIFARDHQLSTLAALARMAMSPHPGFSVFTYAGRVPLVSDGSIEGLRGEEERAAATIRAMREAETREEAERIRIAALRSEAERRRATRKLELEQLARLRTQARALAPGTDVQVADMPALVGVTGVVESNDGAFAEVRFGTQSWKIEGWRLLPTDSVQLAA